MHIHRTFHIFDNYCWNIPNIFQKRISNSLYYVDCFMDFICTLYFCACGSLNLTEWRVTSRGFQEDKDLCISGWCRWRYFIHVCQLRNHIVHHGLPTLLMACYLSHCCFVSSPLQLISRELALAFAVLFGRTYQCILFWACTFRCVMFEVAWVSVRND